MSNKILPEVYHPIFSGIEAQIAIKLIKDTFERKLAEKLNLIRVSAPLMVPSDTGINDMLNGYERPVEFEMKETHKNLQIVQSLAKWKRIALKKYGFQTEIEVKKETGEQPLFGLTLCFTGKPNRFQGDAIEDFLESNGAKCTHSVSKSMDYLITGEKPGS